MELVLKILLYIHIGAGMWALVVAPIAMVTEKGGKRHKLSGKIYFWAMTVSISTAIVIAVYKFIPFLLMVAVFSYYSVFQGYRTLFHKSLHLGRGIKTIDWVALAVNGLFNLAFVIWGFWHIYAGDWGFFAYLAVGFGFGGLAITRTNFKLFKTPPSDKNHWLFTHINGMVGGYIATLTAFSATTLSFLPGIVAWIWPTVIGAPLIAYWIRRYRKLLAEGKNLKDIVILDQD